MQCPTAQTKPQPRRRRRVGRKQHERDQNPKVELIPADLLKIYRRNARQHPLAQITQLKNSIEAFGFINPILADAKNVVVAGHGRLQAARELGLTKVPVLRVSHLSDTEIQAYRLADNKIAENAT